jgi:hypothetical protein
LIDYYLLETTNGKVYKHTYLSPYMEELSREELDEELDAERKEFFSRYSTPLDDLIEGINMDGLSINSYSDCGPWYESNTIESDDESFRRGAGVRATTPYADEVLNQRPLKDATEEELNFWRGIKDSIVLDLASGREGPYGYVLASALGAKAYVGVDKFCTPVFYWEDVEEIRNRFKVSEKNIPYAMVQEDAVDFAKRVPNETVSVFTFALTGQIGIRDAYARELEREIFRVLNPKGTYLSYFADFEPIGLNKQRHSRLTGLGGLLKFTKPDIETD